MRREQGLGRGAGGGMRQHGGERIAELTESPRSSGQGPRRSRNVDDDDDAEGAVDATWDWGRSAPEDERRAVAWPQSRRRCEREPWLASMAAEALGFLCRARSVTGAAATSLEAAPAPVFGRISIYV